MKIFLQIVLVLLCVFFLLMSACGALGLVVVTSYWNGFREVIFPVVCLVGGAGGAWATVRLSKKVSRTKDQPKESPNA